MLVSSFRSFEALWEIKGAKEQGTRTRLGKASSLHWFREDAA